MNHHKHEGDTKGPVGRGRIKRETSCPLLVASEDKNVARVLGPLDVFLSSNEPRATKYEKHSCQTFQLGQKQLGGNRRWGNTRKRS